MMVCNEKRQVPKHLSWSENEIVNKTVTAR